MHNIEDFLNHLLQNVRQDKGSNIVPQSQQMLKIDYVRQLEYHCGPACLEMVYKHLGRNDLPQETIFNDLPKQVDKNGNTVILLDDLVKDAAIRGFQSYKIDFTSASRDELLNTLKSFLDADIPVISLGQWKADRTIGHFRLILDVDENYVYFHDPDIPTKRDCLRYNHEKFFSYWQSNNNLIRGLIIFKQGIQFPLISAPHNIEPIQ